MAIPNSIRLAIPACAVVGIILLNRNMDTILDRVEAREKEVAPGEAWKGYMFEGVMLKAPTELSKTGTNDVALPDGSTLVTHKYTGPYRDGVIAVGVTPTGSTEPLALDSLPGGATREIMARAGGSELRSRQDRPTVGSYPALGVTNDFVAKGKAQHMRSVWVDARGT
nr:hypothetical protein [Gemmatimonadaceae bacterium]